ncbi:MAG: hypothetical protein EAZ60_15275 [Oscillatoriales cyanobacterium]|nr:MAG: hypothetical protein EAZ83_08040 [Oscillatoriales cyanobacterium]TAE96053.1 MAG: hypothetical protein EAZ79_15945 [Oscillatoriales cyanobacterium]TAF21505.1 MAG: hypothetical protein EAZ73_08880 [Oscillatoriales cyanobacterium]TAF36647.1 MAG: hypothetical protein EAZ69_09835 [Oscillatoriales cyanobacterium]TAF54843.1 MAG: hypothetical protein EAZ60_15275 [Oscillatoriales cyanobacterium]
MSIAINKLRRGGFYKQYLMITNSLYKPARTQLITYVNLDFYPSIKMYILIVGWVGAGLGDNWFET